ncbi:GAF domain-containing sensor histidine kinase [Peribacillus sp. SCS-26]|uniref:GAF domain-containing sensor histidine kinase n=1 Tax=Paraperibacillus marinus TaxID=3115295 RepID=UPI003906D0B6
MEERIYKLRILKEIAEKLNEGTSLEAVLQDVLVLLLEITEFETGWIFLMDSRGNHHLAAHHNLPPALKKDRFAPMCTNNCWCVSKFSRGTLTNASNIMECKRLEEAAALGAGNDTGGLTHHATVPLRAGSEQFGLLNVAAPGREAFNQSELDLLESVAFQIGASIKRIRLQSAEQENVLIQERNRLARDLHDSVNQLLFSVSLTARAGREMTDQDQMRDAFTYIQEMSQRALAEMKALIWQLRPQGLENGLIDAISGYGKMIGLEVHSQVEGLISLPAIMEEALWRIGQEALNNCKKHSGEKDIYLHIKTGIDSVLFEIQDHGKGCLLNGMESLPSLGLSAMRERAERLDGTFSIRSTPGKGTAIRITIPLQKENDGI